MGKFIDVPYLDQTGNGAFTGCESVTAVMLLHYLGYDISIREFIDKYLEKEPFEVQNGKLFGADPRLAFAGDPYDPEAMGCYAPVICKALTGILGDAYQVTAECGTALDDLVHRYIDYGMPVVLWATIDMKDIIIGPEWYLLSTGELFTWRSNEHCLLLVGYDDENYIFNDPWQNNGIVSYPRELVEDRYQKQYAQAVTVTKKQ